MDHMVEKTNCQVWKDMNELENNFNANTIRLEMYVSEYQWKSSPEETKLYLTSLIHHIDNQIQMREWNINN